MIEMFAAFAWAGLMTFAGSAIFGLGLVIKAVVTGRGKS